MRIDLSPKFASLCLFVMIIQGALVIHGFVICRFVIRGFDYLQLVNCVQNSLSVDISLGYPQILPFFMSIMDYKMTKQWSLVICGFGIRGGTYPHDN